MIRFSLQDSKFELLKKLKIKNAKNLGINTQINAIKCSISVQGNTVFF